MENSTDVYSGNGEGNDVNIYVTESGLSSYADKQKNENKFAYEKSGYSPPIQQLTKHYVAFRGWSGIRYSTGRW